MTQHVAPLPRQDAAAYGVVVAPGVVRFERILPGPIERVWAYLTDSKKRSTWLAAGEMELRPGGRVEHVFKNSALTEHDDPPPAKYVERSEDTRMHGRILGCDPPNLLAYSWGEVTGEHADAHSAVRFELTHVRQRRAPCRDTQPPHESRRRGRGLRRVAQSTSTCWRIVSQGVHRRGSGGRS